MGTRAKFLVAWLIATGSSCFADVVVRVEEACQSGESWSVESADDRPELVVIAKNFRRFVKKDLSPAAALANAEHLARTEGFQALGEYWMARVYLDAGLTGFATERFDRLFSSAGAPWDAAALSCLGETRANDLSPAARRKLMTWLAEEGRADKNELLENSALLSLIPKLALSSDQTDAKFADVISKQEGLAARYLKALRAVKAGKLAEAEEGLREMQGRPARRKLAEQQDQFRLMLGRTLYQAGRFEDALDQWQDIDETAPAFASAQSDRAWALLKKRDFSKALRFAAELRRRERFLPEPLLVAAASLQELCQYPSSLDAVRSFRRQYGPLTQWLKTYRDTKPALFPLASSFAKGQPVSAPATLAAEWVKAPVFTSAQRELDRLQKEETFALGFGVAARVNEDMPEIERRLLAEGKTIFKAETANYLSKLPALRTEQRERAEADLARRTLRMAHQLNDVDENLRLVEVEVLHGAAKELMATAEKPPERLLAATGNEVSRAEEFPAEADNRCK